MLGYRSALLHLRRHRRPPPGRVLRAGSRPRPQAASHPRQIRAAISNAKNELIDFESFAADGQRAVSREGRRRLPPVPAAPAGGLGHGLRRPADGDRRAARGLPRGAGALPGPLPLHPGGRVPGHQPRPVPAGADAGRQASQRLRGRRLRPEHLRLPRRRHPQHPRVRAGLPRRHGSIVLDRNYRSTQTILDAANAVIAQQPGAQAQAPVDRSRRGRPDHPVPGPGRARRGGLHRRATRGPRGRGHAAVRCRRLLPDPRPDPGDRGGASSATASRIR